MLTRVKRDTTGNLAALDPADEADLIARCRADERAAQDELYHRFRRQVAGNLYRVLGDRGDLDDLVQEVFVIAFRGLERFRGDARLSASQCGNPRHRGLGQATEKIVTFNDGPVGDSQIEPP